MELIIATLREKGERNCHEMIENISCKGKGSDLL